MRWLMMIMGRKRLLRLNRTVVKAGRHCNTASVDLGLRSQVGVLDMLKL